MGVKGSWSRPQTVSSRLKDLNYKLAFGKITEEEYNREKSKLPRDEQKPFHRHGTGGY